MMVCESLSLAATDVLSEFAAKIPRLPHMTKSLEVHTGHLTENSLSAWCIWTWASLKLAANGD